MTFSHHSSSKRFLPAYFLSLLLMGALMPTVSSHVSQLAQEAYGRAEDQVSLLVHEVTIRTMNNGYPF